MVLSFNLEPIMGDWNGAGSHQLQLKYVKFTTFLLWMPNVASLNVSKVNLAQKWHVDWGEKSRTGDKECRFKDIIKNNTGYVNHPNNVGYNSLL